MECENKRKCTWYLDEPLGAKIDRQMSQARLAFLEYEKERRKNHNDIESEALEKFRNRA